MTVLLIIMIDTVMVPHMTTLPPETSAVLFQFGGPSDTASVWVLVQAL